MKKIWSKFYLTVTVICVPALVFLGFAIGALLENAPKDNRLPLFIVIEGLILIVYLFHVWLNWLFE